MNKSKIEWTERTWNPVTGCSKVSEGCYNCYAQKMANRLFSMGNPRYLNGFDVTLHEDMLKQPLKIKKPSIIFVCSMSDLFHDSVPFAFIEKIVDTMEEADWHVFQILTKRTDRMYEFFKDKVVPDNIWLGTSLELEKYEYRVEQLKRINSQIKFLSCEPLLGSLKNIDFKGIDWIVTGGESGAHARPVMKEWVLELRDICLRENISFFFKQWGGWNKKKNGNELDGVIYNNMPKIK